MTSKYIKFGLRADKNLADLDSPVQSLANVLDDNSTALDENNQFSGFTVRDISPLIGLRNTGLSDFTNEDGQSTDLANLNGTVVSFTNTQGQNTVVEPLVTIQDNISNFKSVLGNPPWINGGDGLNCFFVGSDRIKPNPTGAITGNSGTASTTGGLSSSQLWTSYADGDFTPIIGPLDFWNNGVFAFNSKLHPEMRNTYGLIQWTGYLASNFEQDWGSTGLFIIEEDTVDDGSENNWTTIKSVYATPASNDQYKSSFPLNGLTYSGPTAGVVTIDYSGSSVNKKSVCEGMSFVSNSTTYQIASVDPEAETMTVQTSSAISGNPATQTLKFKPGEDEVTSPIKFTAQKRGNRLRVRYTLWYPDPGNGSAYREKTFRETNDNSERAPFSDYYKTYNRSQVFGPYTYKYFEDNKASALNQKSTSKLTVLDTISLIIDPPELLNDKVVGMSSSTSTTVSTKTIKVRDNFGKISATSFSGVSVGDWMVFKKSNNNMYAFQILEISGSDEDGNEFAYVKDSLNSDASMAISNTAEAVFFKNTGLIGLFRLDSSGNSSQGALYSLPPYNINPTSKVFADQLIMTIKADGTDGLQVKRVFDATGTGPRNVIIQDHLSNAGGSNFKTGNVQIGAVYASRGLDDKSSYLQCNGVYGREVNATAGSGQNQIELTTTDGVTVGDYVHFYGSGSAGGTGAVPGSPDFNNNKVGTTTTVQSINNSTKTITLTAPLTAAIPKARTIVFIKSTIGGNSNNPGSANKEFCVIPLNTAPPFEGTTVGLLTPESNRNLTVAKLTFNSLKIQLPNNNITALSNVPASSPEYFPITYGSTTYKILLNT